MIKKNTNRNILYSFLNKKKYIIIIFVSIIIYIYFHSGIKYLPIEDLDIPSGVGIDLITDDLGNMKYSVSISFYNYGEENKISSLIHTGVGNSIPETRETRQLFVSKKMSLGIERVHILSERFAKFGIQNYIDIIFKNPIENDTAFISVCKGKVEDVLSYNVPKYPSSADYIEGLLEHCTEFNFFSNRYTGIDITKGLGSEGKNVVLPYIEIKDDKIQITGMAIFKEDIMVEKMEMDQVKVMNMLRENNVKGMLTIHENIKEYISYYAQTKREVRCEKRDDKYTFFIDLTLNGDIVENNLFHDIHKNDKTIKEFEINMTKYVEKECFNFIKEMQNKYKIDFLELGNIAAAQYGRHTGVDWNEVVSNSDIKVNVKIKIDKMGRGDY